MRLKRIGFFVLAAACAWGSVASAASMDELNTLTAQLQANPADAALREQIIRISAAMQPAPAVPEEARKYFVQGNSAFTESKTPEEVDRAIALYRDASSRAPWWPDVYFNLAKALEQREQYDEAIAELKRYLLAAPNAADAREAQDRIYVLEEKFARVSKAAADQAAAAQAAAAAAAQRKQWASSLHSQLSAMFAGRLIRKDWVCSLSTGTFTGCTDQEYQGNNWYNYNPVYPAGVKFDLSADGEKILFAEAHNNGPEYGTWYDKPYTGTPNGPYSDDISWVDHEGKVKQLWFWTAADGLTYYQVSDSPVRRGAYGFDPNVRYMYWKHQAS